MHGCPEAITVSIIDATYLAQLRTGPVMHNVLDNGMALPKIDVGFSSRTTRLDHIA